jgi:hypothetical protein
MRTKLRTKLRSKISLLFLTCAVVLAIPAIALADNAVADGDDTVAFNDSNMAMGSVCSGVESSKTAPVKITRTGNATATNTFANGATVTVTASVTGAGLSAEMASPNTITLPSNWTSVGNGTLSDSVSSTVKVNSSVAGAGSGTATYSATGLNSSGATITRTDTMNVTWTTANCDTTPPVITKDVTGTVGNNGWYTTNVGVDWTVSDSQSAISSQSGCADFSVTSDQNATTYTCTATSAGGTSSDSVTIKRDATQPTNVQFVGGPNAGGSYTFGNVPNEPTCTADDATSTIDTCVVSDYSNAVGEHTLTATATDKAGNKTTATRTYTVNKATPTITWDAPAAIDYGTALNATQLNATANVAGTFAYTPEAGTVLNAGTHTLSVQFTPNDTTNYNSASKTVSLTVNKADATIDVNGYTGAYDGNAHGATGTATGVDGADLSNLLNLGASFTDAPGGTANWSFDGNTNYKPASGSVAIVINKADATVKVNGYTGTYDGNAHGATGTATGVNNENLSSLLNLGASFTNVPGGTANWSFSGGTNYNDANGTASIVINKATATVQLSGLGPYIYDGTAKSASATTSNPAGLNVTITYNGSTTAPTDVGSYNVVATVDNPNYQGQATGTLVISPWTTKGFYAPVDMGGVVNTVKGGSTVPLKFELFSGATELTDTSAIKSLTATKSTCAAGATEDAIEVTATGATSLRYDSTGGQFIYNWKTPTGAGCYTVTLTAQDGSTITAYFKSLK